MYTLSLHDALPILACVGVAEPGHFLAAAVSGSRSLVGGGRLAAAAAFADPRLDATRAQRVFELPRVVAAVGPQLLGPVAGRAQRVDQGQQVGAFVLDRKSVV